MIGNLRIDDDLFVVWLVGKPVNPPPPAKKAVGGGCKKERLNYKNYQVEVSSKIGDDKNNIFIRDHPSHAPHNSTCEYSCACVALVLLLLFRTPRHDIAHYIAAHH